MLCVTTCVVYALAAANVCMYAYVCMYANVCMYADVFMQTYARKCVYASVCEGAELIGFDVDVARIRV